MFFLPVNLEESLKKFFSVNLLRPTSKLEMDNIGGFMGIVQKLFVAIAVFVR